MSCMNIMAWFVFVVGIVQLVMSAVLYISKIKTRSTESADDHLNNDIIVNNVDIYVNSDSPRRKKSCGGIFRKKSKDIQDEKHAIHPDQTLDLTNCIPTSSKKGFLDDNIDYEDNNATNFFLNSLLNVSNIIIPNYESQAKDRIITEYDTPTKGIIAKKYDTPTKLLSDICNNNSPTKADTDDKVPSNDFKQKNCNHVESLNINSDLKLIEKSFRNKKEIELVECKKFNIDQTNSNLFKSTDEYPIVNESLNKVTSHRSIVTIPEVFMSSKSIQNNEKHNYYLSLADTIDFGSMSQELWDIVASPKDQKFKGCNGWVNKSERTCYKVTLAEEKKGKQFFHEILEEIVLDNDPEEFLNYYFLAPAEERRKWDNTGEGYTVQYVLEKNGMKYFFIRQSSKKILILKPREYIYCIALKKLENGDQIYSLKSYEDRDYPLNPKIERGEIAKGGGIIINYDRPVTIKSTNNSVQDISMSHSKIEKNGQKKMYRYSLVNPRITIPIKIIKSSQGSFFSNLHKNVYKSQKQFTIDGKNQWQKIIDKACGL